MLHALPLFHRIAGQAVIVLGDGEAAEAKRRLIERAGGHCVDESDTAARLAFVAHDEPEDAARRLRARGILVNVVDRPELCDFTVPSVLERDPVLIAVGTGGASAGLAKALRLRLETLIPPAVGTLASNLLAARAALRSRFADPGERRRALDRAFAQGGPLDPLDEASASRVSDWLDGAEREGAACVEVRLASTDPDDLTLRQARLLGSADLLLYEPGIPAAMLDRARADAVRRVLETNAPQEAQSGLTVILRLA